MQTSQHPDELTPRGREVLDLVRLGLTNEEIAERLGISLDGAKYHVSQILSKLGVTTREEAAAITLGARPRWWAALPLAAKAAGAAIVLAAVAGLGLLAWGVLRTSGEGVDGGLKDELAGSPGRTASVSAAPANPTIPPTPTAGPKATPSVPLVEFPSSDHPAFNCPTVDAATLEPGLYTIDFTTCGPIRVTDGQSDSVGEWSPDGQSLVLTRLDTPSYEANSEIYFINRDGSGLKRITDTPDEREDGPIWSPDGSLIAFAALDLVQIRFGVSGLNEEEWTFDLKILDPGTLAVTTLLPDIPGHAVYSWSPSGRELVVLAQSDIRVVNVETGATRVVATDAASYDALWSPDGSMIAYTCKRPGFPDEVACVVSADGSRTVLLSGAAEPQPSGGIRLSWGRFPRWSSDGLVALRDTTDDYLVDPRTGLPVGRMPQWRASADWFDSGLVFGSRCSGRNSVPCPLEAVLQDLGTGRLHVVLANTGCGIPARWSADFMVMSFAIGSYGTLCL